MENEVKAIYKKSNPVESKRGMYPGFKQETRILPKGYKNKKSAAALECDIIFERDVAVTLRDGTTIYTDILRPNTEEPVPAVVVWSPYGKNRSSGVFLSFLPGKMGVGSLSNLEKCEGPDPAYWCKHGYAVCQPDIRGTFNSEGIQKIVDMLDAN